MTPVKDTARGKRGLRSPLEGQPRKRMMVDTPGRLGSLKATRTLDPDNTIAVDLESEIESAATQ